MASLSELIICPQVQSIDEKNIPASFLEWLAEILRLSAFLGWAVEHLEGNSRNLVGIFVHNSVHCTKCMLAFDGSKTVSV